MVARDRRRLRGGRPAAAARARSRRSPRSPRRPSVSVGVLRVVDDRQPERARRRRARCAGAAPSGPATRRREKPDDAGVGQLAERGQRLARPPDRDRAVGEQLAPATRTRPRRRGRARARPGSSSAGVVLGIAQTVVNPPWAAAAEPGRDRLGVLVAGLAEVRVEVDEPGRDDDAVGVDARRRPRPSSQVSRLQDARRGRRSRRALAARRRVHQPGAAQISSRRPRLAHAAPPTRRVPPLPRPASRYSSAIRTATPLVTCSVMTDWAPAATSAAISTPSFIGPGCMTSASGFAPRAAARGSARSAPRTRAATAAAPTAIRSCWIRSAMTTSASRSAASTSDVTVNRRPAARPRPAHASNPRRSVAGPHSQRSAPAAVSVQMLERATREWSDVAEDHDLAALERAAGQPRAHRVQVEQRLGRVGVPAVAAVEHGPAEHLGREVRRARHRVAHDEHLRRPAPRPSGPCRPATRPSTPTTSPRRCSRRRPTGSWPRPRTRPGSASRPRRTGSSRCRPRSAGTLAIGRARTSRIASVVRMTSSSSAARQAVDVEQVAMRASRPAGVSGGDVDRRDRDGGGGAGSAVDRRSSDGLAAAGSARRPARSRRRPRRRSPRAGP